MAGNDTPPPEQALIRVHSPPGGNNFNPVEAETPALHAATRIYYGEINHFRKWFPWLIPSFIIANVVMFVITMYLNDCPQNSVSCVARFLGRFSFQPFRENPLLGPSSNTLQKMGALDVSKVVHKHQVWRLITCIWLHGGIFHLLANMLSLLAIGIQLEREFGYVRIGLLYIISGVGGSLLSALFIKSNISVGASGALFGLLGSMLSELFINWTIYANMFGVLVTLLIIIAVNLAVGILPHVDNFAHIGGFLSGFFLGFVFLIRPHFGWVSQRYAAPSTYSSTPKPKFKVYQLVLWGSSLILLIIGLTTCIVMLLHGVDLNEHCSWCHYLSCVPTSKWSCNTEPISCLSEQFGNELRITCSNSNRTRTYQLPNPSTSQIQGLCGQFCR
ncbi:hypothetical protein DM860_007192 [Cuscuta australis]|uniref:RHOMBOID-like protein n=1 Tax=Cuscuta australis TaxID=267555 RepID=A0A328E308_9ASTE|nr:hypothetical protein DM860_007192 [Cuscuta australis]